MDPQYNLPSISSFWIDSVYCISLSLFQFCIVIYINLCKPVLWHKASYYYISEDSKQLFVWYKCISFNFTYILQNTWGVFRFFDNVSSVLNVWEIFLVLIKCLFISNCFVLPGLISAIRSLKKNPLKLNEFEPVMYNHVYRIRQFQCIL